MDKEELTLSFDGERMRALTIYQKSVPEPVREYLDIISAPAARPKRPPRPSQSKAHAPKQTPTTTDQGKENAV